MVDLTIADVTASGEQTGSIKLSLLTDKIILRELIRKRVYEEVREYNQNTSEVFRGFIQPTDAERVLNGYKLRKPRIIDWQEQADVATKSFSQNGYFVLVDDKQVDDLDQEIVIGVGTTISFMKLVPLVGG